MKDFIAIDFETANECPSSVCSIGAVLVRNGEIVKTFYSFIRPEPDYYKWFCQQVHGLGHKDTDDADVFPLESPILQTIITPDFNSKSILHRLFSRANHLENLILTYSQWETILHLSMIRTLDSTQIFGQFFFKILPIYP